MKKVIVGIVCLLLFQCSETVKENPPQYGQNLSDCLSTDDIKTVDKGVGIFESLLINHYKSETGGNMETYQQYMNDMSKMSLPKDFFSKKESLAFLKEMQKTATFEKIFIRYEDYYKEEALYPREIDTTDTNVGIITTIEEEEIYVTERIENASEEQEDTFQNRFTFRSRGEFLKCLMEKTKNKSLTEYFESLIFVKDISPGVYAYGMEDFVKKLDSEKERELFKLSIIYQFYYEAVLVINQF